MQHVHTIKISPSLIHFFQFLHDRGHVWPLFLCGGDALHGTLQHPDDKSFITPSRLLVLEYVQPRFLWARFSHLTKMADLGLTEKEKKPKV